MESDFYQSGHRALQDRFDSRRLADRLTEVTVSEVFTDYHREVIADAAFFFLATADADGWPDVSYKGGVRGFVRVLDNTTLAFPSYDGNGMYRSMGNIADNPKVGLLFVDFERSRRIRVKGVAALVDDAATLAGWPGAELVVEVTLDRAFLNCPRYIHKMTIDTLSEYAPCEGHTPPEPGWKEDANFKPYLPGGR